MVLDIEEGFGNVGDSITKTKIFKQVTSDYERLKKKAGKTTEKKTSKIAKRFNKISKTITGTTQNFNKQIENAATPLDNLLNLKLFSADDAKNDATSKTDVKNLKIYKNGNKVTKYIINKFVTALNEIKPKLIELLIKESLKVIGCSENQTYTGGQEVYVKLQSIDYLGQLKIVPFTEIGQILYEQQGLTYPNYPYPMNKELFNRIENINQPFSVQYLSQYQGKSTQNLFDITYVEQDNLGNTGNFYKIKLANRVGGNKVKEFLKDYYSTIEILDFKNIIGQVINQLTGAISIKKGDGKADLGEYYKILLIMKRILGLCFDSTKEIDVSGSAKVSDLNNIDDSFFELTEVDLNFIDQQVSLVVQGLAEFTECDNIQLPIDADAVVSAINNIVFTPGGNNNNTIEDVTNIMDSVSKNPDWFPIEINFDFEFIKEFPKGVIFSVLSPKALLPLNAMFLALGNDSMNKIDSYVMFMKTFKEFFVNLATKINSIFVKIIFESVKEDIKKLIQSIIKNITSEKNKKRLAIILSLTQIISSLAKILTFDLRECKNIIQELQNLLNLASKGFGTRIPLPLLLSSKFLEGFSASRAFIETIGELEKLGIPTGPMPDGSPNKYLIGMKALIDSMDKEEATNGQVQVACEGFAVTPIGITTPGFCFGKKI